jgi:hypothetical protein
MTNDGLVPPPSFLIVVIYCGAAQDLISCVSGEIMEEGGGDEGENL